MQSTENFMQQLQKHLSSVILLAVLCLMAVSSGVARTKDTPKDKSSEQTQRDEPTGVFDQQRNTISKIDFWTTNYGIFGFNVRNSIGGLFWPRGTINQYGFAGGAWFAALKRTRSGNLRKLVLVTYNPNSGLSWMVPGSIEDGTTEDASSEAIQKNKTYFSTSFNETNGSNIDNVLLPGWPVWDADPDKVVREDNYYGSYINEVGNRNQNINRKGPAFISQEDIFAVYKDTELNRYEGGVARRQTEGYPLGLQVEQTIYSWGFGDYADFCFIKYLFIHPASFPDTLRECWMAGVQDVDIALGTNSFLGASNDLARYYEEEDSLNLAIQWTNGDRQEGGRGFGYMGFNFLESPAVDARRFIRTDKLKFPVSEQLGLETMRNWPISEDPIENEDRYNFMSSLIKDVQKPAGDARLMMATGPFNMRPGDSARIVLGLILANTALGGEATGTTADAAELIRKVRFAQFVYNNSFRAPRPPDITRIKGIPEMGSFPAVPEAGWLPLNNAIVVQWDSTAELSVDTLERGLDFLGYRIYRARRTDLDTFNRDEIAGQRRGPLGWKQIAEYRLPPIFLKSTLRAGNSAVNYDSLQLIAPHVASNSRITVSRIPLFTNPWGRLFNQLLTQRPSTYRLTVDGSGNLQFSSMDRFDSIRFVTIDLGANRLPELRTNPAGQLDPAVAPLVLDSLITLIRSNKVRFEPFLFDDTTRIPTPSGFDIIARKRPFEELSTTRYNLIAPYMRQLTNKRTFIDDGDDDNDGTIAVTEDPRTSERLVNSIEYYYNVGAFDEGDYTLPVESKNTPRAEGLPNFVRTTPSGARPGEEARYSFRLDENTTSKLGGIYNVRLLVKNEQLFNQLFAGRTLELDFYRFWSLFTAGRGSNTYTTGLYGTTFILRDSTSQSQLGQWSSLLAPELCPATSGVIEFFTENSRSYSDTSTTNNVRPVVTYITNFAGDTVDSIVNNFNMPDNNDRIVRQGAYTTNARCNGLKFVLGSVGVAFDFAVEQSGGLYRKDTLATVLKGPTDFYTGSDVLTAFPYSDDSLNTPSAFIDPEFRSLGFPRGYNNGRGRYLVEFLPGGTESITTTFTGSTAAGDDSDEPRTVTFPNVQFLNLRVTNLHSFERDEVAADGSVRKVVVSYPDPYVHEIPESAPNAQNRSLYPFHQQLNYNAYSIAAYGWRNTRSEGSFSASSSGFRSNTTRNMAADENSGLPIKLGKYYVSRAVSQDGRDTLDFLHVFVTNGAHFVIDYTKRGRRAQGSSIVPIPPSILPWPTADFAAGDSLIFSTSGGAFGFPQDGAKAFANVEQYDPELSGKNFTDDQLEQITVTPNPFYISHEGIRSNFQGRLYFSRLPRKATISIYTINGELVRTLQHDESTSDDPSTISTLVWDLLNSNRQRIASQTLVAKIETPSGASVIRKFTLVVGPARLIGDSN
jgi:hypothetical protein